MRMFRASCFAAALCLGLAACGGGGDDSDGAPPAPTTATVEYSVSTAGNLGALVLADVTYSQPGAGTAQQSSFAFTKTFTAKSGDFLYVSAQNNGLYANSSVTSTIKVNGVVFRTVTSLGRFSIATATGTCCK
ncbi:MAG TPA: hypothetical protein VLK85_04435 [Ramlibacter sp.]|nr:hypothetical protein [Ramlibacter sp.]